MTDDEVRAAAKAAKLPKLMWDTNDFRALLGKFAAAAVAAERDRCKAVVQYSQIRNGYHDGEHSERIGHYDVRMLAWIDSGHDPRGSR